MAKRINTFKPESEQIHCSFCGKPESEFSHLIMGLDSACICDKCVEVCSRVLLGKETNPEELEAHIKKLTDMKDSCSNLVESIGESIALAKEKLRKLKQE